MPNRGRTTTHWNPHYHVFGHRPPKPKETRDETRLSSRSISMQRSCIITDSHTDVHVVCWTESVLADTMRCAILRSRDRAQPSSVPPPTNQPIFAHTLSRQLPSAMTGRPHLQSHRNAGPFSATQRLLPAGRVRRQAERRGDEATRQAKRMLICAYFP